MKKVVVAIVVSAVSFASGLGGLFFALPYLAPERVQEARQQLDSLGYVFEDPDSLAALTKVPVPDTSGIQLASTDSMAIGTDSLSVQPSPVAGEKEAVVDSTAIFRRLLASVREENKGLKSRLEDLQRQVDSLQARQVKASDVASTLTKLEDRELSNIVQQLDLELVNLLYQHASPKNQSRLLAAMPADRAARLVRNLIKPGSVSEPPREAGPPVSEASGTK